MARRKNLPEAVRVKSHLSERVRQVRVELFGERGGSEMARRLGLPIRTWYNYEAGVTVPAEVLLRFVELTAVEPLWLLHGRGPKFRTTTPAQLGGDPAVTVESLLRTALRHLEWRDASATATAEPHHVRIRDTLPADENGSGRFLDPVHGLHPVRSEWLTAQAEDRCIRIHGDAMTPIVADAAQVAYADAEESVARLEGKLVVAWLDGENEPVVRWFRQSGRYGLLRAENPEHTPSILLIDLETPGPEQRLRRVLWISTPH
jgi:hypothetical protein